MAHPRYVTDALSVIDRLYQKGLVLRIKSMKLREPTMDELIEILQNDDEDEGSPTPSGPNIKVLNNSLDDTKR